MRTAKITLWLLLVAVTGAVHADQAEVTIADPYIELHTGPGVGYPIFHVGDRGETVTLLKRRTDWFKVRTVDGREGWVERAQLERTLTPSGETLEIEDPGFADAVARRFEMGVLGGDFGGADVVSLYAGYTLSTNLSLELWLSQALGSFSDSEMAHLNIVHRLLPHRRVSPYFTLGTGIIRTSPKATLVRAEDREDQLAHVGAGVRIWLARRFLLRAEYKSYVIFTSRDENDEIDEVKAGLSFFF